MPNQSKAAVEIACIALALGAVGDMLLRITPWGLNFGLWIGLIVAALYFLARRHGIVFTSGGLVLPCVMLVFALMLAWHDSLTLDCLNITACITAFSLTALRGRSGMLSVSEVMEYPLRSARVAMATVFGVLPLLRHDIAARIYGPPSPKSVLRRAAIGKGLILTTPLIAVFGGLLMSADPGFNHDVASLFDWHAPDLAEHCVLFFIFAALGAGMLRTLLIRAWPSSGPPSPPRFTLGITEVTMILGALNVLFCAFVLAQIRYFFGGAQYVHATLGMDYSEYARSGFFQLVWVTALALPLLLTLHGVLTTADNGERVRFHALAVGMIFLLLVILDSALQRMMLYTNAYGLTELRLYTTAFMGWLALVLAWFVATVSTERRERFAFGAIVAGFFILGGLNALNPNALIARVNLERMTHGGSFDAEYVAGQLGTDPVPALVQALPQMRPDAAKTVAMDLLYERTDLISLDWRDWNWSRSLARNALRNRAALEKVAGCSVETKGATQPPCPEQDDD